MKLMIYQYQVVNQKFQNGCMKFIMQIICCLINSIFYAIMYQLNKMSKHPFNPILYILTEGQTMVPVN